MVNPVQSDGLVTSGISVPSLYLETFKLHAVQIWEPIVISPKEQRNLIIGVGVGVDVVVWVGVCDGEVPGVRVTVGVGVFVGVIVLITIVAV